MTLGLSPVVRAAACLWLGLGAGWGGAFAATAAPADGLAAELDTLRQAGNMPGLAVVVVEGEDLLWSAGFGWAAVNEHPVSPDTLFLVASVSKPVTATAVMAAAEEGLLGLDEDLAAAFAFPLANPHVSGSAITPRHLLAHTGSIVDLPSVLAPLVLTGDPALPLDRFLADYLAPGGAWSAFGATWSFAPPGTRFEYSNVGIALAGHLVERRAGQPFERYVARRLFEPAGIHQARWFLRDLPPAALAVPYRWTGQGYTAVEPYGAPFYPAVLLRASARELGRFLSLFLNDGSLDGRRILSSEAIAEMGRVQFAASGQQALGWRYVLGGGRRVLGHGGSGTGVTAEIGFDRQRNRGVVVLTNVDVQESGGAAEFQQIFDRLFRATEFPPPPPPPPQVTRSQALVPAVVRGPRGGGEHYRTDLWLANGGAVSVSVRLSFWPRGGGEVLTLPSFDLPAGSLRALPDVLHGEFGLETAQGALEVEALAAGPTAPALRVSARTHAVTAAGVDLGLGQAYPALEIGAGANGPQWVTGVAHGSGRVASLVVINPAAEGASVEVRAWGHDGSALGPPATLQLSPRSQRTPRLDALFPAALAAQGPFTLEFRGANPRVAGATVLDAASGDTLWLPAGPERVGSGQVSLPRVLRGGSQLGGAQVSELVLFNPGEAPLDLSLLFRPRGRGQTALSRAVRLPARRALVWEDVLRELFGVAGDGAGALILQWEGGPGPVVTALGFQRPAANPGLRFGTYLPWLAEAPTAGRAVAIGARAGAGEGSAVGLLAGPEGSGVAVRLTLTDAAGAPWAVRNETLAPGQHFERALVGLFPGLPPATDWRVEVTAPPGAVTAYLANLLVGGDVDVFLALPLPAEP